MCPVPTTSPRFSPSSRSRLTRVDLDRFPGNTLFDRLGRALCQAGCLPRKELDQSWEVARRTRRLFRGGRIVDVGGGHGLLAQTMLLLDDTSPAVVVADTAIPASAHAVHEVLVAAWPRLAGRVTFDERGIDDVVLARGDVLVSCHACGALTDRAIACAVKARARVAVLPCCHDEGTCDAGPLRGWLDLAEAIDVVRAMRLADRDYRVWTQTIPPAITPKNRLLLGAPR